MILVTTWEMEGVTGEESFDFFLEPRHITVALLRAKDGLLVVGKLNLLLRSAAQRRLTTGAARTTPIVTSTYIEAVAERFERFATVLM